MVMRRDYTICTIAIVCAVSSCEPSKKEIKDEFARSCITEADRQTSDARVRRIAHDYCECAGEKAADKFSPTEWKQLDKMKKEGRVSEMQARIMPVIQPCEEEMRKRIMEDTEECR